MTHAFLTSLTSSELRTHVLLPLLALLTLYAAARALVERLGGPLAHRRRRRSWLLAVAASAALSALGAATALGLLAGPPGALLRHATSDPPLSRLAVCAFGVFLLLDLGVGFLDYGELVDPLTGYAHHTFFLLCGAWALAQRQCGLFTAMAVIELPTLLLGLGALHAPLQSDAAFAASFVATRLAYTLHFTGSLWGWWGTSAGQGGAPLVARLIMLPVCCLHVVWFYTWATARASKAKQ
jgi:hypothetical protein